MGHGDEVSSGFCGASLGEVAAEHEVILPAVAEPEPALLSAYFPFRLVGVEPWFSAFFGWYFDDFESLGRKEKSCFVMPAGDGVVRDVDVMDVSHGSRHLSRRHCLAYGVVDGQHDRVLVKAHKVPAEHGVNASGEEFDFLRFGYELELP